MQGFRNADGWCYLAHALAAIVASLVFTFVVATTLAAERLSPLGLEHLQFMHRPFDA
ncbi:hypothetical protein IE4872_CH03254 [Rhizobium gallicum]|uniref:Uncharacterized protein n=1 Tax=Rhizobium gallicum TaxID=56730 RepID=A0A1L5NLS9_9HYPH|nr:hypothetical protein [Rhizobium gallicum]APO68854.1 hypothetical protein IE4872_CH03254 [Rhizobium gallicum]